MNIFAFAVDAQAAFAHRFIIAAHEEMHVATKVRQLSAIITTDRARTDDGDAEVWQYVSGSHIAEA